MYRFTEKNRGFILKTSIFATGCAGIVAEFVLSTLATYLIGDAIFQWALIMSVMLFAMGVGSRLSRLFTVNLLDSFILVELFLSVICASSVVIAYGLFSNIVYPGIVIYVYAFIIGLLIGLEIPMVTRLNNSYEQLRVNISGVLEKDYYGSLLGGLFFAFIALPYLGLKYTPVILGTINLIVANMLIWFFYPLIKKPVKVTVLSLFSFLLIIVISVFASDIIIYGEQKQYRDKIILSKQTQYQKIVITKWKEFYWLYINKQEQFSTYDEEKYHEPLVHPAMKISPDVSSVLVLGGGDGLCAREILKHKKVRKITLVDLDPEMTVLSQTDPVMLKINKKSMINDKIEIINSDASKYIKNSQSLYGVIIADLPDPDSIDLMHVYSRSFYMHIKKHLIKGGVFVTQATSPYFSKKAFLCILKTVRAAGFTAIAYHNQIPTMGEWGWVIGINIKSRVEADLKKQILTIAFDDIKTKFINRNAMISMINFGKGILDSDHEGIIKVNTEINPVLYRYYASGTWEMY